MSADGIFVSYRRSDSQHAAGRLADALSREFGDTRIFRDIEDIEAGADFVETLDKALASCRVMLVIIGSQWLDLRDQQGARRLDSPQDWVRLEIARALQRGVRVVPVLLDRTDMPPEGSLPDDLKPLARRQAVNVADGRWQRDVAALIDSLRPLLGEEGPTPVRPVPAAPTPLPQTAPSVGATLGGTVRTGLTWVVRLLLGLGLLVALLTALLVRACNAEPPDMSGRWSAAEGGALDFAAEQVGGAQVYRATGTLGSAGALQCVAEPSYFESIDLACNVTGAQPDRFTCSLYISEGPAQASGDCKWERTGITRKLVLRR